MAAFYDYDVTAHYVYMGSVLNLVCGVISQCVMGVVRITQL